MSDGLKQICKVFLQTKEALALSSHLQQVKTWKHSQQCRILQTVFILRKTIPHWPSANRKEIKQRSVWKLPQLNKIINFKYWVIWTVAVGNIISHWATGKHHYSQRELVRPGYYSSDQPINQSNLSLQTCQEKHATALPSGAGNSTVALLLCDHHRPVQLRVEE